MIDFSLSPSCLSLCVGVGWYSLDWGEVCVCVCLAHVSLRFCWLWFVGCCVGVGVGVKAC